MCKFRYIAVSHSAQRVQQLRQQRALVLPAVLAAPPLGGHEGNRVHQHRHGQEVVGKCAYVTCYQAIYRLARVRLFTAYNV